MLRYVYYLTGVVIGIMLGSFLYTRSDCIAYYDKIFICLLALDSYTLLSIKLEELNPTEE